MKFEVDLAGRIEPGTDAVALMDATMEYLSALRDGRADPSISGVMADGSLEISVTVVADTIEAAISQATAEIRAALAAGGAAPDAVGWERLVAKTAVAAPAR